MTPVMKADYQPVDDRYPIVISGPEWWEKMSIDEAKAIVDELNKAIDFATAKLYREAA